MPTLLTDKTDKNQQQIIKLVLLDMEYSAVHPHVSVIAKTLHRVLLLQFSFLTSSSKIYFSDQT